MTSDPHGTQTDGAFTLIELVAAIMVMTVLVLILLPALRSMQRTGLRQRAASQAAEIAQAVLDYRRTYGTWPLENEARETEGVAWIVGGEEFEGNNRHLELAPVINLLRGLTRDGAPPSAPIKENPRDIVFLELPASCLAPGKDGPPASSRRAEKKGTPLDPWGRPYVLVLARQKEGGPSGSSVQVGRIEGGVRASVETGGGEDGAGELFHVDSPDDAVVFSWGDPAMATGGTQETRVIGSWSLR